MILSLITILRRFLSAKYSVTNYTSPFHHLPFIARCHRRGSFREMSSSHRRTVPANYCRVKFCLNSLRRNENFDLDPALKVEHERLLQQVEQDMRSITNKHVDDRCNYIYPNDWSSLYQRKWLLWKTII